MRELILCYTEQVGYDIVIGLCRGLDLGTILRLEEIEKEMKLNPKKGR